MGHINYKGGEQLELTTLYILLLAPTIFFVVVVITALYNSK